MSNTKKDDPADNADRIFEEARKQLHELGDRYEKEAKRHMRILTWFLVGVCAILVLGSIGVWHALWASV